jgi:hypothetical protein
MVDASEPGGNSDTVIDAACEAATARCQTTLPFVDLDPDNPDCPRSTWTVKETGSYYADLATGVVYAEALIDRSKQLGSLMGRMALEAVLQEIVRKGYYGPIEQGFLGRFAMSAIVATHN